MLDFLQNYSVSEIIIFLVFFAIAFKETIAFVDWAKTRLKSFFDKEVKHKENDNQIRQAIEENLKTINDLSSQQKQILEDIHNLTNNVNMLIQSDKDDIKAWITEKHHYYCYTLKYIDSYNLECIERRFSHYVEEGGNSFIEALMKDLRNLPKVSSTEE